MPTFDAVPSDSTAFDALAADYDQQFTDSVVGRAQRGAVWSRLALAFPAGSRVLELGCGTGEDARFLADRGCQVLATDRSPDMIDAARRKLATTQLNRSDQHSSQHSERRGGVALRVHDARCGPPPRDPTQPPFDGILANFGVLNCLGDQAALAQLGIALADEVRPGGRAVLCVMGPWVPWEWLWFLAHGQPRVAFRRLRPAGVDWRGLRVRYPRIGQVTSAWQSRWRPTRRTAVGALIPPSYAEAWAQRHFRFVARLARWERRFEANPLLVRMADHYVIELERRP